MKKFILVIGMLTLLGYAKGQVNSETDTARYMQQIDYDTLFDKQEWMKSILAQHFDKISVEYQQNFDHPTPFTIIRIQNHNKYYTIDIEDTTHQYRYTVISIKDDRCQAKDIIKVNETYYLTIKNVTKYSGLIGTSEIPYDITFRYCGKKIRYRSTDIQNGPPVITEDIKGIYYMPLDLSQKGHTDM
jgi:hypothetical protein